MQGIDVELFTFDFDLTWAAFLMNRHGHVYARYGCRKDEHAEGLLSLKGLARVLRKALEAHSADADRKPAAWTPRLAESARSTPDVLKTGRQCMHCHQVFDYERRDRGAAFDKLEATRAYPLPENVGVTLDHDLASVVKQSTGVAAKAGVKAGDEIVALNGTPVWSAADMSHILHEAKEKDALRLEIVRAGAKQEVTLAPDGDWKRRDISWRGSMWPLRPHPGFGGPRLKADELARLGVTFGFRIQYLVDWGEDRATGEHAKKAGFRKGDVVVSCAGKSDFASELEFQAWFRLTRKEGEELEFGIVRDGKPLTLKLKVLP